MKAVGLGVAGWLALSGAAVARAQNPTNLVRLSSTNFAVISDGAPATANQLLIELEVFRETVSRFLGLPREQRARVNVYLWADRERFDSFRPPSVSRSKDLTGFHVTDGFTHVLVVRLSPNLGGVRSVLFHEYTHLLTSRLFRVVPVWMNEGLAEVFSTFQVGNRQFTIGGPLVGRLQTLSAQGLMPAGQLLEVRHDSPAYQDGADVPRFYASAWLLAHALTVHPGGFNATGVRNYIIQSGALTNRADAFRRAFGVTPDEASGRAEALWRSGRLPTVVESFDGATLSPRTVQALTPAEAALEQGTLARAVQRHEMAEALLREADGALPGDCRPEEQLGLLLERLHRPSEALARLERAIALGSVSCQVHFVAGSLRWNRLAGRSLTVEAMGREQAEIRRLIERAVQLDPVQANPHAFLALVRLHGAPPRAAEAEAEARRALQLDPYLFTARLTLARALLAQGNRDDARRVAVALMASPAEASVRREAAELAEELGVGASAPPGSSLRPDARLRR